MVKLKASKGLLFIMLVVAALLGATGQLLFKFGVNGGLAVWPTVYLAIGIVAYLVSTGVYLVVLSRSHLSWAYGLNGISYIAAVLFALVFLGESIPVIRWVGVAVIAIGAALIGFS